MLVNARGLLTLLARITLAKPKLGVDRIEYRQKQLLQKQKQLQVLLNFVYNYWQWKVSPYWKKAQGNSMPVEVYTAETNVLWYSRVFRIVNLL